MTRPQTPRKAAADVQLLYVQHDWPRFGEIDALRHAALYEPFGVPPGDDFRDDDPDSVHLVALVDDRVVGYGRLIMHGNGTAQIRHMAVDPDHRRRGIATALAEALTHRAWELGATEVWLNARVFVMKLYRQLGFEPVGYVFKSAHTGILHQRMVLRRPA